MNAGVYCWCLFSDGDGDVVGFIGVVGWELGRECCVSFTWGLVEYVKCMYVLLPPLYIGGRGRGTDFNAPVKCSCVIYF